MTSLPVSISIITTQLMAHGWIRMKSIKYVLLAILIPTVLAVCNLPPDFWCDTPATAVACMGTTQYCDAYNSRQRSSKFKLDLAFESACPDSQQFVVYRLYPQVLNNRNINGLVDFKAFPWGLAKRDETAEGRVRCHHGARECAGNRLLSCAFLYYVNDSDKSNRLFSCFMSSMMYRATPGVAMKNCLQHVQTPEEAVKSIIHCAEGSQADDLQKHDEAETAKILARPRFVPFIALGGRSHIHMQAYQMFLGDKLKIWNETLHRYPQPAKVTPTRCSVPFDFWCSDPAIINECGSQAICTAYQREIQNKRLEYRIIYDSTLTNSVQYILGYVKNVLLRDSTKVLVRLEPTPTPNCDNRQQNCADHAVQECIATKITDPAEQVELLLCLLENKNMSGGMKTAWEERCHFMTRNYTPKFKDEISRCANSTEWQTYSAVRSDAQRLRLQPEPKRSDPWLVINGHSSSTVQHYQRHLHRTTCLWYRGNGHDRDACARCEYEATHC
uniref:Saposin A-type domain-containing protein n=1 Tax=Panagrellus redivivus TaxID=6233 RepID=A0A7E4ZWC0_PANRE